MDTKSGDFMEGDEEPG